MSVPVEARSQLGSSRQWVLLAALATLGFVLRVYPLVAAGDPWRVSVDYDNGVYFSAAALWWQNAWPYKDYVFVHPPGIIGFYAPVAAFASSRDPAAVFTGTRWMAAAIGALNVFLTGRAAIGLGGPLAGVVAAGAYATHAEAVDVERGPFLEPALNLFCLLLGNALLRARGEKSWSGALLGFLGGLGLLVKLWGGVWIVAAGAALWSRGRRRKLAIFLLTSIATAGILAAPFLLKAPGRALHQVLQFQLWRPPDGPASIGSRLFWIGRWHPLASLFGLVGAATCLFPALRRSRAAGEPAPLSASYYALGYGLLVAAFLLSPTYWNQYNAHLAPAESALAGLAFSRLADWIKPRWAVVVLVPAALLLLLSSLRHPILSAKDRDNAVPSLGRAIRQSVPRGECLLAFEAVWGLAGGRLPADAAGTRWVDPYAAMLLDAQQGGGAFSSAAEAFASPWAQTRIRPALEACRFVVLGPRGNWQLSGETKSWLGQHFERRFAAGSGSALDLWERQ